MLDHVAMQPKTKGVPQQGQIVRYLRSSERYRKYELGQQVAITAIKTREYISPSWLSGLIP